MKDEMNIRLIMAIIIAAHGIGHIMGVMTIPMGMFGESGFKQGSWLLTDRLGLNTSTVRALGTLWLIATIAFMAAAYGYFYDLAWWRTVIKASVILSVALFVVWWDAFPANIPIQANLGNVAAIIALFLNA
jgi:hypothetical protein